MMTPARCRWRDAMCDDDLDERTEVLLSLTRILVAVSLPEGEWPGERSWRGAA